MIWNLLMSGTPEEYMWYMIVNIGFFVGIVVCIIFGITLAVNHFYITKGDARTINRAARGKKGILAIQRDDGFTELKAIKKLLPEGIAFSTDDYAYFLPSPLPENGQLTADVREDWNPIKRLFGGKSILRSAGVPFWNVYSGGMVAVNAASLATLEYAPEEAHSKALRRFSLPIEVNWKRTKEINDKIQQPVDEKTKDVEIVFPVDSRTAHNAVPHVWHPSQWRATEHEIATNVQLKMKKAQEKMMWLVFIPGIAVLAVGLALVIVTFVLGK